MSMQRMKVSAIKGLKCQNNALKLCYIYIFKITLTSAQWYNVRK